MPVAVITGRDAAVEMIRGSLTNARTAHQVHTPLIELNGDEAQIIWAMQDRVVWENGPALTGNGHYHERWVRDAGRWNGVTAISSTTPRCAPRWPTAMSCTTASSMHGCGCAIRRRDTFDEGAQARIVSVTDRWREHGLDLESGDLGYAGERNHVAEYLDAGGWRSERTPLRRLLADNGLPVPSAGADDEPVFANNYYCTSVR
jgi:hypothetical protein